jgi:hypothetical protein
MEVRSRHPGEWKRPARGKEERVIGGHLVVHPVWDYVEWTRLARDAEGGVFVAQGFVVRDDTRGGCPTDPLEVEGALGVVAERQGWALADVGGRMTSGIGSSGMGDPGTQLEGGWWIVVPVNYLGGASHPDLEFRAEYEGRDIVFWAIEAHVERFGGPKPPEFDHRVEFALRGKDLYVHDYHPDAPWHAWGRERRGGG